MPPEEADVVEGPLEVADRALEGGGRLRVLTLHRPEVRNAMDAAMLSALVEALDAAEGDPEVRGLLVTGHGSAFSAGADLREPSDDGHRRRTELFTVLYERLSDLALPTAAAVEGPAVGGGAEVAAACDLRAAADGAVFRFPGAVHGLPVGVARTVGQVGLSTAKDWVLSSRDVPAAEAHAVGFVQRLTARGAALDAAVDWLEAVATRHGETVRLLKRLLNEQAGVRDRVAIENEALRAQAETGRLPPAWSRRRAGRGQ